MAAWRAWRQPQQADGDDEVDDIPELEFVAEKVTVKRQILLAWYDALG